MNKLGGAMILRILILCLVTLVYQTASQAQDLAVLDSLKGRLMTEGIGDSIRGEIYKELGSKFIYTDIDSFKYYSRLSLEAFKKTDYLRGQIRAIINIGNCHTSNNELDSATFYLQQAEAMTPDDDYESLVFLYFNYAYMHHNNTNEYEEAIKNYLKAIDYAELLKDSTKLAVFHYNIADIFGQNGLNEKAFPHNQKALMFAERTNLQQLEPIVQYGIGVYYLESEQFDSSEYYFKNSLVTTDTVSDFNGAFYAYNGLSETEFGRGLYEKSYEYGLKANHYAIKMDVEYELAMSFCKLSASALMSDRFQQAQSYWDTFSSINDSIDNHYLKEICFRLQYESLAIKGRYERAFLLSEEYIDLRDSVFAEDNRRIISDLESKYESDKKEIELEKQEIIIQNQIAQRKGIIAGTGLVIAISLLGLWTLIQRSRKNKLLYEQSNTIQNQKIEKLEKERKILSMNAMIEGQEAERTRIAKDLHDGLGGLLSTVKAHFSNIQREIKQLEGLKIYDRAQDMMDEACDEVRRISHNLMPGALRLEGLKTAVEQLAEEMNAAHPFKVNIANPD